MPMSITSAPYSLPGQTISLMDEDNFDFKAFDFNCSISSHLSIYHSRRTNSISEGERRHLRKSSTRWRLPASKTSNKSRLDSSIGGAKKTWWESWRQCTGDARRTGIGRHCDSDAHCPSHKSPVCILQYSKSDV